MLSSTAAMHTPTASSTTVKPRLRRHCAARCENPLAVNRLTVATSPPDESILGSDAAGLRVSNSHLVAAKLCVTHRWRIAARNHGRRRTSGLAHHALRERDLDALLVEAAQQREVDVAAHVALPVLDI